MQKYTKFEQLPFFKICMHEIAEVLTTDNKSHIIKSKQMIDSDPNTYLVIIFLATTE
jgi:hypothetical protein